MRTKIVCTIGPASSTKTKLRKMIEAGMTVARINFSHGSHESNGNLLKNIRLAAAAAQGNVGIMADLQGPRIRLEALAQPITLKDNQEIFIYEAGRSSKLPPAAATLTTLEVDAKKLLKYLKKGDPIYIDNGMMEVTVLSKSNRGVFCRVKTGGVVKSRKGINIPRISPLLEAFTKSDQANLEFALGKDVDFIAMSFVKSAKDILKLKKNIKRILIGSNAHERPAIIAKIETQEAVKNFEEIMVAADGIMIARGDLAIELPMETVPSLQKQMIKKCLHNAKPVIVATQMLESMMENPRPTRAEITDVANAVIDHADALMLSGESAMGNYPVKTVRMMSKIIRHTEAGPYDDLNYKEIIIKELVTFSFIARGAVSLAQELNLKNIIIRNAPRAMAYKVSRFRPELNIWYVTKNKAEARKLSLSWGVQAVDNPGKIKGGFVLIDGITEQNGTLEYHIKHQI